jgi:transposase
MEAPMKRGHFIGIDVHCQFCEIAVVSPGGHAVQRHRCATSITALIEVLDKVPRPRQLVIEQGPLAGWLWRNLRNRVDTMVVSDPRRNRLIAEEGDKDDDLDAEKLAQLYRGGYIKPVHQMESLDQVVFKEVVAVYYHRVRQRRREAQRIASWFRQHGVMARERDFASTEERAALLAQLPQQALLREALTDLWPSYDGLVEKEETWRTRVVRLAQQEEVIRRLAELPGVSWIRGATFYAFVDTPWRFRSKQALWKYLGIGLERQRSGSGPERLGVPFLIPGPLKCAILGAALSAVTQGKNPFADHYRRWLEQGLSPKLARRSVARMLAATLWGLWKNGSAYRPEWVGVAAAAQTAAPVSR